METPDNENAPTTDEVVGAVYGDEGDAELVEMSDEEAVSHAQEQMRARETLMAAAETSIKHLAIKAVLARPNMDTQFRMEHANMIRNAVMMLHNSEVVDDPLTLLKNLRAAGRQRTAPDPAPDSSSPSVVPVPALVDPAGNPLGE